MILLLVASEFVILLLVLGSLLYDGNSLLSSVCPSLLVSMFWLLSVSSSVSRSALVISCFTLVTCCLLCFVFIPTAYAQLSLIIFRYFPSCCLFLHYTVPSQSSFLLCCVITCSMFSLKTCSLFSLFFSLHYSVLCLSSAINLLFSLPLVSNSCIWV